jgi:hypothetical protein
MYSGALMSAATENHYSIPTRIMFIDPLGGFRER